jgi:hypothetical protein
VVSILDDWGSLGPGDVSAMETISYFTAVGTRILLLSVIFVHGSGDDRVRASHEVAYQALAGDREQRGGQGFHSIHH